MSIELMAAVWKDDYYTQGDKAKLLVALAIADAANGDGYAFPSVDFIARKARTSIRGVQEVCRELQRDGKLEVQEGKGRNGTNLYRVTPPQPLHPAAISPRNGAAEKAPEFPPEKAPLHCTQIIRNHQEPPMNHQESKPQEPPNASASPALEKGESKAPKTDEARFVASLFSRKLTTEWSAKEIRAFKDLVKRGVPTMENLLIIERYYVSERMKNGAGRHRRDLGTFLNNFDGELDRAATFAVNPHANNSRMTEAARDFQNTGLINSDVGKNLKLL